MAIGDCNLVFLGKLTETPRIAGNTKAGNLVVEFSLVRGTGSGYAPITIDFVSMTDNAVSEYIVTNFKKDDILHVLESKPFVRYGKPNPNGYRRTYIKFMVMDVKPKGYGVFVEGGGIKTTDGSDSEGNGGFDGDY